MTEQPPAIIFLIHGIIALFGAIVHALKAHRGGKTKTIVDFFILTVMSSFTGVMFSFLGLQLFPNQIYITLMLAGSGGFMGVEGMAIIIDVIRQLVKVKDEK